MSVRIKFQPHFNLLCAVTAFVSACDRPDPASELAPTLQALTEQLAQQQALLHELRPPDATAGWNGPPPAPGDPTGSPPGALPPVGPATGSPGNALPSAIPPGPPGLETAFFRASAETAASAIPSFGPPTLVESVWSGSPLRFPFLAQRGLPESTMLIFREHDLTVVGPDRTLSFRADYQPTAMVCRQLWPCVVVVDEDAVIHPVWYEVLAAEQPGEPATLFVLDCITRDQIEGGAEFPSDEALLQNGGLVARHRTDELLCVRRASDIGLMQVRIAPGGRSP